MNIEEFMNYTLLALFVLIGGGFIVFDAWRDRHTKRECAPTCVCDFCYYGIKHK